MKLAAVGLSLAYGQRRVIQGVSLEIASGEMVAIVGPNGSGKSTLLRGLGRLHRPTSGHVLLGDSDIRTLGPKEVARTLAVLPQSPGGGMDLTVRELVWRGRYPHQGLLQRAKQIDHEAVAWAMAASDIAHLAERTIAELSGGERQRAWIALALAQQPRVLLLDEPTSFLDIQHQVEIMEFLGRLNADGMTIVAVVHDLVLAARYAMRVIAMRDGVVQFDGAPADVFNPEALERVFGIPMMVLRDPETGQPIPLPRHGSVLP